MTFWTEAIEPLRKYRFLVRLGDSNYRIDLKSCSLPNFETDLVEYKLINHNVKFPGIGKWGDCQMSFVVANSFAQKQFLDATGYRSIRSNGSTLTKTRNLGIPKIELLDENGGVVTRFNLHNAWIQTIEYGELTYADDEFVEVNLTISMDTVTIENVADMAVATVSGIVNPLL